MLVLSRPTFVGFVLALSISTAGLSACSSDDGSKDGGGGDATDGGADSSTSGGGDSGGSASGRAGRGGAGGSGGSGVVSGRGGGAGRGGSGGAGRGGNPGLAGTSSGGRAGGGSEGGAGRGGSAGAPSGSCSTIATFEDGKVPEQEIHVATTGSDSSGDGSEAAPFASLERAVEEAVPGSAVRIHPGTYGGDAYIEGLTGSAARPIWIGGVPGEARPVIEGGGTAAHFVRASWLVLHDLEIREQTDNGINADDGDERADEQASHGLIFRDLFIHDVGSGGNQDCLKLSGVNEYLVLDSRFARCGGGDSGSAIDHVGCHDGLIARNEFSDLTGGGNAVQCKGGSRNIEVRWNRITNGGQRAVNMGGSTGPEFFRPPLSTSEDNAEARNIRVIANVIEGGIAALGFVGCVDCLAANNTIVEPDKWVLRILQETTSSGQTTFLPAQNGHFVNNLVYFARAAVSTTINVGANTSPETFVFGSNLWYAHDAPNRSTPTDFPAAESDGIYGEDPGFSGTAGDYAIGTNSPAAGAGEAVSGLSGDITGECFADPPSIGAYEAR